MGIINLTVYLMLGQLKLIDLNNIDYNEDWIKNFCYNNPSFLPIDEIELLFHGMMPICRELSTPAGPVDLIYVNAAGMITVGECKR